MTFSILCIFTLFDLLKVKTEVELPFPNFPNSSTSFPTPAPSAGRWLSLIIITIIIIVTLIIIIIMATPRLGSGKLEKPSISGERDDERELAKNR